jgi:hypothetical protein
MITLKYTLFDLHGDVQREGTLSDFILDAPGLIPMGIVPPLRILNELLSAGMIGGGMSPGCQWAPFRIDGEEYDELVADLLTRTREELLSRPYPIGSGSVSVDETLAGCGDFEEWIGCVGRKYGHQDQQ